MFGFVGGLVCKCAIAGGHLVDVTGFCKSRSPVCLPVVPRLVNDGLTFPLVPWEFHPAASDHGFGAGRYHHGLKDGDASVVGKGLALFLLACVDSKWKMGVDARVELGHVIFDVRLQDGCVGGPDVCNEIT